MKWQMTIPENKSHICYLSVNVYFIALLIKIQRVIRHLVEDYIRPFNILKQKEADDIYDMDSFWQFWNGKKLWADILALMALRVK